MRRLLALLVLPLALTACDSGGDDPPESIRITGITVDAIPATKPDGSDWDGAVGSGGPDVYANVFLNSIKVKDLRDREFGDLDQDELPQDLSLGGDIVIDQLNSSLSFVVRDKDGGAASDDDIMGTTGATSVQGLVDAGTRVRTFTSPEGVNLRVTFAY